MKTLSQCIVDHGTEAVREYREMSGGQPENEMPEIFLGGCIARGIHRDLGCHTMVERLYTEIAKELGVASSKELTNAQGGLRTDVAVYQQRLPIAIVEIKKFEHRRGAPRLNRDLEKMRRATLETGLPFFFAAMISETETSDPASQLQLLEQELNGKFDAHGPVTPSGDGKWKWQFACGSFSASNAR